MIFNIFDLFFGFKVVKNIIELKIPIKFQWSQLGVYKNITLYRSFKKSMLKWEIDYVYGIWLHLKMDIGYNEEEFWSTNWLGGVHSNYQPKILSLHGLQKWPPKLPLKNEPLKSTFKRWPENTNFKKSYLI